MVFFSFFSAGLVDVIVLLLRAHHLSEAKGDGLHLIFSYAEIFAGSSISTPARMGGVLLTFACVRDETLTLTLTCQTCAVSIISRPTGSVMHGGIEVEGNYRNLLLSLKVIPLSLSV